MSNKGKEEKRKTEENRKANAQARFVERRITRFITKNRQRWIKRRLDNTDKIRELEEIPL